MPEPIIDPATIIVESNSPRLRLSCRSIGAPLAVVEVLEDTDTQSLQPWDEYNWYVPRGESTREP